jgi:hypothetical protein
MKCLLLLHDRNSEQESLILFYNVRFSQYQRMKPVDSSSGKENKQFRCCQAHILSGA